MIMAYWTGITAVATVVYPIYALNTSGTRIQVLNPSTTTNYSSSTNFNTITMNIHTNATNSGVVQLRFNSNTQVQILAISSNLVVTGIFVR